MPFSDKGWVLDRLACWVVLISFSLSYMICMAISVLWIPREVRVLSLIVIIVLDLLRVLRMTCLLTVWNVVLLLTIVLVIAWFRLAVHCLLALMHGYF